MAETVPIYAKGRVAIPLAIRNRLGIEPGDLFTVEAEGSSLRFTKIENPFDLLAQFAIAEYHAGRTKNLREFASENGFSLEDDQPTGTS